ncbi:uncharacterized protein LOC119374488 isoform X6 [Rhipicephalus sanguineus]|uniref:uncharacterized protein LOC119374488 isoform X6 n=1 Tax=Rhipicephalus sanguineus TaxID=34632 RepID=UPI0020C4476A|nr:uncharacterized protein LOC119374488 isoform X6 [Rhipicephalus sanguineus]
MYATACGVPKAAFTAVKFVLAKPMQDSAKQTHPWILATAQHHKSCCAEWCRNSSRHTGIKFFRIPADERSRAWLQYARRQDLAHLPPCQIYSSYRLCSAHFTSRDYADPGQTRLLRCAVPTVSIFGDGQTHVESPGGNTALLGPRIPLRCPLTAPMKEFNRLSPHALLGPRIPLQCPLTAPMKKFNRLSPHVPIQRVDNTSLLGARPGQPEK